MPWRGKRGKLRSPYHYDMRTGLRERLSDMQWQRGILTKQIDTAVIGDRERQIERVFKNATTDAEPDKKLTSHSGDFVEDFIFNT